MLLASDGHWGPQCMFSLGLYMRQTQMTTVNRRRRWWTCVWSYPIQ